MQSNSQKNDQGGIFTIDKLHLIVDLMKNKYLNVSAACQKISKVEQKENVLILFTPVNFSLTIMKENERIVRAAINRICGYSGQIKFELEKVLPKEHSAIYNDPFVEETRKMFRGKIEEVD